MRFLIGCEESQTITIALRNVGVEAFSCDLQPCSGGHPEWHYQCDIYDVLYLGWDAIGMHPDCTKLTVSGNAHYAKGKEKYNERLEAAAWTEKLWTECCRICDNVFFENPIGVLPTLTTMGKPNQVIQPYEFGHPESKATCLWIKGFSLLKPTKYADFKNYRCKCGGVFEIKLGKYGCPNCCGDFGAAVPMWDNQTKSGQNKLAPSPDRKKIRSKTYKGIAEAIAMQWTNLNGFAKANAGWQINLWSNCTNDD